MLMGRLIGFGLVFGLAQVACAHQGLLDGRTGEPVSLERAVDSIPRGSVVLIGENHGLGNHRDQQMAILKALRAAGHEVSVALEFFTYTHQDRVEAWRSGELSESDFLRAIEWGGTSFDFYRSQALFPRLERGERTWAINAPRSLTSRVARVGLEGLTAEERALLPPQFALGRDSYRERFEAVMPHLPPGALPKTAISRLSRCGTTPWLGV